jgi:hypothetical protein
VIRITYNNSNPTVKRTQDVSVKTVFLGRIGSTTSVYMQTFLGVVDLADPNHTWGGAANAFIYDYKEVDIDIRVNDKKEV